MTVPILILAAGASRRMLGRDKLLIPVDGVALLRHVVGRALATGHPVLVTLPAGDVARRDALRGLDVQIISVENSGLGMAQSLQAGIHEIPKVSAGLLVGLADMPDVTTDDYLSIINDFIVDPDVSIHRAARHDGTAGNPVLLPRWALKDRELIIGDAGARPLLRRYTDRVRLVKLPNNHATTDLDTPEDWAVWSAKRRKP